MKPIVAVIALTVAAYLIGAFMAWNFNPGDWPIEGRASLAAITACLAGPVAMIAKLS